MYTYSKYNLLYIPILRAIYSVYISCIQSIMYSYSTYNIFQSILYTYNLLCIAILHTIYSNIFCIPILRTIYSEYIYSWFIYLQYIIAVTMSHDESRL